MTLAMPLFPELEGVMSRHFLGACMPNLKFLSLAILELLAFNAQNSGHVTLAMHLFREFIFFMGHVVTFPGSMRAKFKVQTLSHFGAVGI